MWISKKEYDNITDRINGLVKNINKLEGRMEYTENRNTYLLDYPEYLHALVNYLGLDFEITPSVGEQIKVIKKKK